MKNDLSRRLKKTRERFESHVWPVMHRAAWPVVWLRRRLRPQKISLSRMEGSVSGGEQPLVMLLGAVNQNRDYLLRLAFQKVSGETPLGTVRLINAFHPKYPSGKNAGLMVLETTQSMYDWLNDGAWFFIPAWVMGEVQLPVTDKTWRSDTFRTIRRKIRKHGFECEVTRDPERFRDFYDNMHAPYITKIFGPTAYRFTCDELWAKCEMEGFDLVLIRKKSEPEKFVAGFLVVLEPGRPRFWTVGVRDGDENLVQEGALAALYHFCFEHYIKSGYERVNMGSSRPFLRDGVLTIKKRLSQTLFYGRWEGFAVRILELNPATKAFLANNPFIFKANGRLHGAVFTAAPLTVKTVEELDHEYFYPGTGKLLLYFFERNEQFQVSDLPPELAARVEIRPAEEIISGQLRLPG